MKKIKYGFFFLLILIVLGLGIKTLIPNKNSNQYHSDSNKNSRKIGFNKNGLNEYESDYFRKDSIYNLLDVNWNNLNITPIETIEGTHYTFTAFDVLNDSIVVFVESYDKSIVRFFNLNSKTYIDSIELELAPFEILSHKDTLYILCENNTILLIKNKQVIKQHYIENKNTYLFDKFLVLNDKVSLLMADGSSLYFENGGLENKESLVFMDTEIWILKNSNFSFVINDKNKNVIYSYNSKEELGSIAIAGGSEDIYCCIDKMYPSNPSQIGRVISSSKSNFQEELIKLPRKNFSFIKNDYRIHLDILYYLEINSGGFIIKRKLLK